MHDPLAALLREPPAPDPPPPFWLDRVLPLLFVALAALELLLRDDVALPALTFGLALTPALALYVRRSRPLVAVLVGFAPMAGATLATRLAGVPWEAPFASAAAILLPYTLARWGSGRAILLGTTVVYASWALDVATAWKALADAVAGAVFLSLPVAIGASVRLQDRSRSRALDQARLHEREALARELHDSVAHHVSAIAIQAQAGRAVAAARPEAAAEALVAIEQAASRTLRDMRGIVAALREDRDPELAPRAGVADVPALADDGGRGPRVVVELRGELSELPSTVDAGLYRLAQESVTNARRHARNATRIDVCVQGGPEGVRLSVQDDGDAAGPGGAPRGDGFGLVGMAERTRLLGGRFHAGPAEGGGWRVQAEIPGSGREP